jgi:hypothetical protein
MKSDPLPYSAYFWRNNSSHPITLSLQSIELLVDTESGKWYPNPDGTVQSEATAVIEPGYSLCSGNVEEWWLIGESVYGIPPGFFYNWIITVSFGSNAENISVTYAGEKFFEPTPGEIDKRFNVTYTENYACVYTPLDWNHVDLDYPYGGWWCYTFTDADYEAAKAYCQR